MGKSKKRTRTNKINQRKRSKKGFAALMGFVAAATGVFNVQAVFTGTFSHHAQYQVTVSG